MLYSEPVFDHNPHAPSCHAATLVEAPDGRLLCAWFAGTHEGHPDVAIWMAAREDGRWSQPVKIVDEPEIPLWNPVLFRDASDAVWLFYKIGPDVPSWTGAYVRSFNGGRTWTSPTLLPAGLLGPAKNKPIALSNGEILCGTSSETWRSWSCWVEIITDAGRMWRKFGPIVAPGAGEVSRRQMGREVVSATWDAVSKTLRLPQAHRGIIQPTVWEFAPGWLRMLMRSTRRVGFICTAESRDHGRTWSAAEPTAVPNSNSGLDAVRLADGRIVLACNPVQEGRTPLSLLASRDHGDTWEHLLDLETGPGEYSYPAIIQSRAGTVHVAYTYQRSQIRHAALEL